MHTLQEQALALLARLTTSALPVRGQRETSLLTLPLGVQPSNSGHPDVWDGWCEGWAFAVQPAFAAAMDILPTLRTEQGRTSLLWTQGSAFNFKEGHTLYDTPEAYSLPWAEALRHIRYSIQIIGAAPASSATALQARDPGRVAYRLYSPNVDRTNLVPMATHNTTQDDFMRFLITGEVEPGARPEETLDAFLETVGNRLKESKENDADLADILKAHILKENPEANAVAQAKNAILELANKRANPKKMEADNG